MVLPKYGVLVSYCRLFVRKGVRQLSLYGIMAYVSLQCYNYFDFNGALLLAGDPSSQLLTVAQSRPFFISLSVFPAFTFFVVNGQRLSLNTAWSVRLGMVP